MPIEALTSISKGGVGAFDSGSAGWTPTLLTMSATQQSTSVTLTNLTSLVQSVDANAVYEVEAYVTFRSAATTTGLILGFLGPTGSTFRGEIVVPITSTAAASQLRILFPNTTSTNTGSVTGTGATAINSNHTGVIRGLLFVGATAGSLAVQFATEVASSAITVQIGSCLKMKRIQ